MGESCERVTELSDPYGLPIKVRQQFWGWFGPPWDSEVCYDGERLRGEMKKDFPQWEECLFCGELFEEGDSGSALPTPADPVLIRHVHKECMLRNVLGRLSCYLGEHNHYSDQTYRQEALELWQHIVGS